MSKFTEEQLRSYVHGKANNELRASIEKERESNKKLNDQIVFLQELTVGLETAKLKDILKSTAAKSKPASEVKVLPPTRSLNLRWLAAAASAALLIAAAYFVFTNDGKSGAADLAAYYQPPVGLPTPMGAAQAELKFLDGMVDYKNKQYALAIGKWESLQSDEQSDTLDYYLAAAHFAQNNYPIADAKFETLADSEFSSKVCWYRALIAISKQEKNKAMDFLKECDHPDKEKLLKTLSTK